ncbi:MAG: FeoA family protein [Proteobacteria bacterium]|nr:FeoA family protein [Pseudomonadota bacterium]
MLKKLSDLKVGSQAVIVNIDAKGDRKLKQRLRDMGIIKNEKLLVKKLAPLNDPLEIVLKGYSLTLRKKEAELINVELINNDK